jgi:excisionase family DNA binding protein
VKHLSSQCVDCFAADVPQFEAEMTSSLGRPEARCLKASSDEKVVYGQYSSCDANGEYYLLCSPSTSTRSNVVRETPAITYGKTAESPDSEARSSKVGTPRTWLSISQVAEYLGISRATAYRLARRVRSFPTPGVGLRFLRDDIDSYVEGQGRAPVATDFPIANEPGSRVGCRDGAVEVLPGLTREELKRKAGF